MISQNNLSTSGSDKPKFEHPQAQSFQPAFGQVDGANPDLTALIAEVNQLYQEINDKISQHIHNGTSAPRINLNTDIIGMFETVSVAPTATPTDAYGQIKIYTNGIVYRLYWFDSANNTWHYVTATA